MRYLLPLAVCGAAIVLAAADETLGQIIDRAIPQCMRSCAENYFESAMGCSVGNIDCICKSNSSMNAEAVNSAQEQLSTCIADSNCTLGDLNTVSEDGLDKAMKQAEDLCNKRSDKDKTAEISASTVLVPGKAVPYACAMILYAAL